MKRIRFTQGVGIYNPGERAAFLEKTADHYIAQGWAYEVDEDGAAVLSVQSGGDDTPPPPNPFEGKTRDELVELANGLEVLRADGKDGDPLVSDYVRALTEAAAAEAAGDE